MRGRLACASACGGAFHVERAAARQRRHLRPRELAADRVHGFEIAFGGDREAGLQNVHASSTSLRAMRSFSGTVMLQPGDCSPSRRVVSKMYTRSLIELSPIEPLCGRVVRFGKFIILQV